MDSYTFVLDFSFIILFLQQPFPKLKFVMRSRIRTFSSQCKSLQFIFSKKNARWKYWQENRKISFLSSWKNTFGLVSSFFFFKKIKTKIIDIREKLSTSEIKMFIRIKVRSMGYLSVHWWAVVHNGGSKRWLWHCTCK